MKKRFIAFLTVFVVCCTFLCCISFAASPAVFIEDYADVIGPENEQKIREKAEEVAAETGFNIVIASTTDIGTPKTDAQTVDYADVLYEKLCGIDTDGILFLINCDTKYDYISTSGVCINYFSDARIDRIFDDIWDDLVDGNYAQAAYTFVFRVEDYYKMGKANHQQEIFGREVDIDPFDLVSGVFTAMFIGLIIGTIIYASVSSKYKIQRPTARTYLLDNSLYFDRREDVYLGTTVNRIYTPRSSSSGRSGGSHRSSTHGGRHR